jgi:hypothetical protein
MDRHTPGQEAALAQLKDAYEAKRAAREKINAALQECRKHHVSATAMAYQVGMSESGIRNYILRNEL